MTKWKASERFLCVGLFSARVVTGYSKVVFVIFGRLLETFAPIGTSKRTLTRPVCSFYAVFLTRLG